MKRILVFVLVVYLTQISCKEDDPKPIECDNPSLLGKWIWIKSIGGVGGSYITPESARYARKIEIDEAEWREYTNDSLTFKSQYIFRPDSNSFYVKGWVDFDHPPGIGASIINCELILECGFEDCPLIYFDRKK